MVKNKPLKRGQPLPEHAVHTSRSRGRQKADAKRKRREAIISDEETNHSPQKVLEKKKTKVANGSNSEGDVTQTPRLNQGGRNKKHERKDAVSGSDTELSCDVPEDEVSESDFESIDEVDKKGKSKVVSDHDDDKSVGASSEELSDEEDGLIKRDLGEEADKGEGRSCLYRSNIQTAMSSVTWNGGRPSDLRLRSLDPEHGRIRDRVGSSGDPLLPVAKIVVLDLN